MPPPDPPAPPPKVQSTHGSELANKVMAAISSKNTSDLGKLRKQVESKLGESLRKGGGVNDNEFGFLLGPINLAESGDWAGAQGMLKDFLDRSK